MLAELSDEIRKLAGLVRKIGLVFIGLICLAYPLSGIYRVNVNETAVLKRFGKVIDARVPPGIHYRLPWPIDQVERVGTGDVRRLQCGFGADPEAEERLVKQVGQLDSIQYGTLLIAYCLTGDKNIVHAKVIVQYRIINPEEYLFEVTDSEGILTMLAQNAILKSVAPMNVEEVLTTKKLELQQNVHRRLEQMLEKIPLGLSVISVEVAKTRPPRAVAQAFRDVVNAQEERLTTIHEAEAHKNQILAEAEATASRLISEARAFRQRRIAHAQGEAQRFSLLAAKYEIDKFTLVRRVYLDAVIAILPYIRTYVVSTDEEGEDVIDLRFFSRN